MSGIPVWLWGAVGGLALGPLGLVILWPACSHGPLALMKRFVISVLAKLILAGAGLWAAIKLLAVPPIPLVFGFFGGYVVSLAVEIIPCIMKVRKCSTRVSQT